MSERLQDILDFLDRSIFTMVAEARSADSQRNARLLVLLDSLVEESRRSDANLQEICGGMFIELCANLGPGVKEEIERTSAAQAEIFKEIDNLTNPNTADDIRRFAAADHGGNSGRPGRGAIMGAIEEFVKAIDSEREGHDQSEARGTVLEREIDLPAMRGSLAPEDENDVRLESIPGISQQASGKLRDIGIITVGQFKENAIDIIDRFTDPEYEEIIGSIIRFGIDFEGIQEP